MSETLWERCPPPIGVGLGVVVGLGVPWAAGAVGGPWATVAAGAALTFAGGGWAWWGGRARTGAGMGDEAEAHSAVGELAGEEAQGDGLGEGAIEPETAERPALVWIEPGTFMMGSPPDEVGRFTNEQQHAVTLTRGFWMAETPVTQAQYTAVMDENPSHFQGTAEDGRRPVENVTWLEAVRYCNTLSEREGLPSAYTIEGEEVVGAGGYRLPTEAEWEYAARAGTRGATYAGDLEIVGAHNAPVLDEIAWYGGNSGSEHPRAWDSSGWPEKQEPHERASTQPVKGKRANGWGLYDMLGNVREWVWDEYGAYPAGEQTDPSGPPRGARRVIRGGSFGGDAHGVRAAFRNGWLPGSRGVDLGFRTVRSAPRVR